MDYSKKRMSIDAIIDHNSTSTLPLSPPSSFKSRSPTLSPNMEYMTCSSEIKRRNSSPLPMSVEERRYRNKLASAKYRAKKQASMKSMASKVTRLMTCNSTLQRELSKVKQEKQMLHTMLMNQTNTFSNAQPPQPQHHLQTSSSY